MLPSERLKVLCAERVCESCHRARKKKCWFSHFFSTSAAATMHIGSLCRWLVFDLFLCFFSLSMPSFHLLLIQIQKHRNNRNNTCKILPLITYIRWGWKSCFSGTNCCKLLTLFFRPTKSCKSTTSPWWRVVAVNQRQQKYIYRLCRPAYLHSSLLVHLCEAN